MGDRRTVKVAIVGSRDYPEWRHVHGMVKRLAKMGDVVVLSGGALGADQFAEAAARFARVPFKPYPANWKVYGRYAGFKRNIEMVSDCDFLIAFWSDRSKPSPGTTHSSRCAFKQGKQVFEYDFSTGNCYQNNIRLTIDQFYEMVAKNVVFYSLDIPVKV
jgi:hypothetical protein